MADERDGLVTALEISYRVLLSELLAPLTMRVRRGECWVITGPNGSGKSILAEILAGRRAPTRGAVSWPALGNAPMERAALVSFEEQERIMERERREDQSFIMHGILDPGHTPRDLIGHTDAEPLARAFGISAVLDRGLRFLSTGEFRKTLIAAAIAAEPDLLVLDEPFDGLDTPSRHELTTLIGELHAQERALVLVVNRLRDLPESTTHVVELDAGRPRYLGPRAGWRPGRHARRAAVEAGAGKGIAAASPGESRPQEQIDVTVAGMAASGATTPGGDPTSPGQAAASPSAPIITMSGVHVSYGATEVLSDVTWRVYPQDRWMIHGPNGSGKSTLLSLITGDNPRAYGQEITLFGRRKGSGESVWQIKRRIGFVSGDLQMRYPHRTTALHTVLSGFHDSLGLYEEPGGYEVEVARGWLRRLGLAGREDARLRELSFGEVRLLLIARAVVKHPELLIADEPTQGLDDRHAALVLELLDEIGLHHPRTALLYVTHNADERLSCLTHELELAPETEGGSTALVTDLIRPGAHDLTTTPQEQPVRADAETHDGVP